MLYFGPYSQAGHFFFNEHGSHANREIEKTCPWSSYDIDGILQPGCYKDRDGQWRHKGQEVQGETLLHKKDGWTAISFWDRSVDTRGGCNSTFLAEGDFTFEQMVEMAKERFPIRWGKIQFEVFISPPRR